jgi:lipopolysaccharide transport system ATP-binding protein
MGEIAIKVESLGKRYRIGESAKYKALRDTLTDTLYAPFRAAAFMLNGQRSSVSGLLLDNYIWALKNVAFEVKKGEVVGTIGRNGAGKSTLLKIMSRITKPTEGYARIYGRVGSLLEVGTGFHPELTGRENVYLNGAILGMRKKEIDRKFDEIVAFAEVEKFIDTPVKYYSSGMFVRLAFAVAAHLEPEILLVDEVLAVGDAAFQKKCLGKMGDIANEGRTVLFVSHNMGAVSQLCPKCIWLDQGQVEGCGATNQIVSAYLQSVNSTGSVVDVAFALDPQKKSQLCQARLLDERGTPTETFNCDNPIHIELTYQVHCRVPGLYGYLAILRMDETLVWESDSHDVPPNALDDLPVGLYSIYITIPARTLAPGYYSVYLNFTNTLSGGSNVDSPGTVLSFTLNDITTARGNKRHGFFSTTLGWKVNPLV